MTMTNEKNHSSSTSSLCVLLLGVIGLVSYFFVRPNRKRNEEINNNNTRHHNHPQEEDTIEQLFRCAVLDAKSIIPLSRGDKLLLYGLYKQATVGDCSNDMPSRFNVVAFEKYRAWTRFKDIPKHVAMIQYVDMIRHFSNNDDTREDVNADIVYENDNGESDDDDDSYSNNKEGELISGFGVRQSTMFEVQNDDTSWHGEEENSSLIDSNNDHNDDGRRSCLGFSLRKAATDGNVSLIQSMTIREDCRGLDVDSADENGQTALHFAADRGRTDCVSVLLQAGANPNAIDKDGISVLQTAVVGNECIETIRLLLKAGADPNQKDVDGDCAQSLVEKDGSDEMKAIFLSFLSNT